MSAVALMLPSGVHLSLDAPSCSTSSLLSQMTAETLPDHKETSLQNLGDDLLPFVMASLDNCSMWQIASTCKQFNGDVVSNPMVRREYLAWAQGFMSGIILSRPPGVDEGLDLNPATFDLITQLRFLEDLCARNEALDFSEAVEALYKRLRREGKT